MTEVERRQMAQWILERNLQWIAAADAKTGAIIAINTGMLGALAAIFSGTPPALRTAFAILFTAVAAFSLGIGLFCAAMALFPRTQGPPSPYIFFGGIVRKSASDYAVSIRSATAAQLLDDCLDQIHRNAQIACDKFGWVRVGMIWSFLGLLPWALALGCLKH